MKPLKKKFSNLDQSSLLMFGRVKKENITEKNYYLLKYEASSNQLTEYNLLSHKDDLEFDLFFECQGSTPCLVIAFGTYSGELCLKTFVVIDTEQFVERKSERKIHNYKITTLKMNAQKKNESILIASGSNDRRVTVSSLKNFNNLEEITIEILYSFTYEIY